MIDFASLVDYLHLLRAASLIMDRLGNKAFLYLAAAVSDFYIPKDKMVMNKWLTNMYGFNWIQLLNCHLDSVIIGKLSSTRIIFTFLVYPISVCLIWYMTVILVACFLYCIVFLRKYVLIVWNDSELSQPHIYNAQLLNILFMHGIITHVVCFSLYTKFSHPMVLYNFLWSLFPKCWKLLLNTGFVLLLSCHLK